MANYIFVVGGVISGTGKGIAAASISLLMQKRGQNVTCAKFDPYLNINAGTMSPGQHGECFLCDDGTETDLDLGHYERIVGISVSEKNIFTSGRLYKEIIEEEEEGKYLGETVQIVPHVTNKIKERLHDLGEGHDLVVVEIGGTVGDLESGPFLEAIRQFKQENWDNTLIMLVAPILWVQTIKEFKTKPFQNSVKTLQGFGLQPEILLCRVDREIPIELLDKIANLANVPRDHVFDAPDVQTIYQVPIEFYNRHVDDLIADKFHLKRNGCRIHKYRDLVEKYVNADELPELNIGVVCKYKNCDEAYVSLKEALYHAGLYNNVRVRVNWVDAIELEQFKDMRGVRPRLERLDGIIVPGGFDNRGVEGKIRAVRYAREKKVPFLGICLGLQCSVIEFSRNVLEMDDANSTEFNEKTDHPVINFVEGQETVKGKSGTMRLGTYDCDVVKGSLLHDVYKKRQISERHRHRYEVNEEFVKKLDDNGMLVSGRNPESGLVEMVELDRKLHPFFIATQAHPEFKSRLTNPAPLFRELVSAAKESKKENEDISKGQKSSFS